jgi:proteic killer suppression protein
VIRSFKGKGTEDVFNGLNTPEARRACPTALWAVARRKLDQVDSANQLDDLRVPPGNRLEALRGDRQGEHCIRINERYRLSFAWTSAGPDEVEIVDYHRG